VDVCDMEEVYADGTVKGISATGDGSLVGVGGFGECRLTNQSMCSFINLWPAYSTLFSTLFVRLGLLCRDVRRCVGCRVCMSVGCM